MREYVIYFLKDVLSFNQLKNPNSYKYRSIIKIKKIKIKMKKHFLSEMFEILIEVSYKSS